MIVVTTIQQALRPFLVMCFIVGLGFYPGKQPRIWWTAYLSILYSLTLWFTYAYLFYYIIILFKIEILFRTSVVIIVTEINIFTLVVSVIMSFYHRKRFATCLKKLAAVDDTLEELGTPKMYRKIYIWSKRVVIVWIMYSMTVNVYESLLWQNLNETVSWGLYLPYILNHSLHINTLVDLLFTFILWYIGTRFDKISEHIRYLSVREERGLKCTWKKPVVGLHRYIMCTDNHKQILWISMHLHLELCHLARELNSIFGTQITFEMASYLLYLTALCYYLCLMLIRKQSDEEIHSLTHRIARVSVIMIDTVEKALSPIFLAASFLGFGIFRYPLNQPRYRLSIFYILTVWSVYAYVLYYMMTYLFLKGVYTGLITFGMTVNLLAAITSIIITICKYEKYRQYTRKLDLVDDTLEELGIPKKYYKIRNLTRKALIMWFLMICITWTLDSLVCIGMLHDTRAIFMPFVASYSIHVNSITDITFILLLRYIGDRLDKINDHIKQLSETEDCGLRC
ncbi:uncharacterized protein LOC112453667, partial [Temnothorax curvispinosus]|uniref:Gustatory receptor n=1 Tax=Temnothorax curvispinosus TaxID=300111 RepID=A0A6J1PL00_9HYME